MIKNLKTTIQQIQPAAKQRLLVLSDIHGCLDDLIQLLRKTEYHADDILIVVGDLIEKGPESLRVLQYVSELCQNHQVYVTMGNVDLARLELLLDDSPEARKAFADFLHWSKEYWGSSLFEEMLADLGIPTERVTEENADEYRRLIKKHFQRELDFLQNRPTILTAGDYLFVHGGVPTDRLEELEGTDASQYLKNDDFWNLGYRFDRYTVVVGHWPACLYRDTEDMSPLFDPERKIICIDGGSGIKKAGQLNCIVLPHCKIPMGNAVHADHDFPSDRISWTSHDPFPLITALEPQKEIPATVRTYYFDNIVELTEEKGDMGIFRQVSTGKTFEGPLDWLYHWGNSPEAHYGDYCNRHLSVKAGETLSLLFRGSAGCYVKNGQGQLGWYCGKTAPKAEALTLIHGSPKSGSWRRTRETDCYALLDRLGISFSRIEHHEANTMEVCADIDAALDAVICKNLFLRNQQGTRFYLLMMPGDKKFKTKELSKQIGSSRLSFAEAVYMEEYLHITPGSVSVMGLMNDADDHVQLLIDRDILNGEWFGCHPCMNTASIRLKIKDLIEVFLPAIHHEPIFVELF